MTRDDGQAPATKEDVRTVREELKEDVQLLRVDVDLLKEDIQILKEEMKLLRQEVRDIKEGIAALAEQLGQYYLKTEARFDALEAKIEKDIRASEDRMIRYIDVKLENVSHDILGAQHDRFEDHEVRITLLEQHTGLERKSTLRARTRQPFRTYRKSPRRDGEG